MECGLWFVCLENRTLIRQIAFKNQNNYVNFQLLQNDISIREVIKWHLNVNFTSKVAENLACLSGEEVEINPEWHEQTFCVDGDILEGYRSRQIGDKVSTVKFNSRILVHIQC